MVLLPVLRAAVRRALASTATSTALCVAGLALTLDPATAAAARPGHKAAHKTASKAAHKSSPAAPHKASHRTHGTRATHASRGNKRHRAHETASVAADAPAPLLIPQFALPDLAVAATTYPAGNTLGGFGGPVQTAMVPPAAAARTLAAITHSATSLLDALVARARSQLGTRYVFGGAQPGAELDCSSFARYAMEALGIRLPRTANQQAQIGRPIPRDVNILRPGDLLTFGSPRRVSHVGIYLGQGRFIHASVSHGEVIETTIERNRSLFRRWQGARRLLAAMADSADDPGRTGG